MPGLLWLWRFYRVVPPVPPLIVVLLVATTIATGGVIVVEPTHAADALLPVFVLQAFAASSGFIVPARRGYYDMLLTRVGRRLRVHLLHCMASIFPGAVCWLALALVEMASNASTRTATLSSGSLAALWVVSCVSWAITTPLPRFAGALGWMVGLIATTTLVATGRTDLLRLLNQPSPSPASALAFLIYPGGLIGQHLASERLMTVIPGVVVATLCAAVACAWLHQTDIRLEGAQ